MKIIRGKKAQFGSAMTAMLATVLIVLILLIFFLIAKVIGFFAPPQTFEPLEMRARSSSIFALLQSPVEVDAINNQNITIVDLIRLFNIDKKCLAALKSNITSLLDSAEYDYFHPLTKNIRTAGYYVFIASKQPRPYVLEHDVARFKSKNWVDGNCIMEERKSGKGYGCVTIIIPVPLSNEQLLFVAMRESNAAKARVSII